jgi:NADPH-dependent ferric siderophore reductase
MKRVVFASPELAGFRSDAFDDHIRLFFPKPGTPLLRPTRGPNGLVYPEGARPDGRDYTPRAYDRERNRLTVDFVLHAEGPASSWAERAKPGDAIGIAGPQNSQVVRGDYDWHLLIGDETALPAIGRRVEELPRGARVLAFVEVADAGERQTFNTAADLDVRWLERNRVSPKSAATLLLDSVRAASFPGGAAFAFIACENTAARALRQHLVEERGLNAQFVRAYRFWQRGAPDLGQS